MAGVVALSGCGPIEYISQVSTRASSAVSGAKAAEADRYAPYEYTASEEYLHKAREAGGHAHYQDAIDYGRKAEDFANRARAIALAQSTKPAVGSTGAAPAQPPAAASDGPAPAVGQGSPPPR